MFLASRYHVVATMGVVLSLAGCADTDFIMRPPSPELLPPAEAPPPERTESVINVPIQLDLSALLQDVNDPRVIPKKFDHWGSFLTHPTGGDYKYYAERDDFTVEASDSRHADLAEPGVAPLDRSLGEWWKGIDLAGSSLFVRAPLRYKIGVRPRAVGTAPGQCGDGPDWPRRAALTGTIALTLTPQYDVEASVRGVTVTPMEACRLRIADMDVQQAVNTIFSDQVTRGLNHAVSPLNALTFKSHAEEVWRALRDPIPLDQDTWLLLNLDKVGRRGFSKDAQGLHDALEMTAHPVIIRGAEPAAPPSGLPPLEPKPSAADFRGVADVQGDYSERRAGAGRLRVVTDVHVDYGTFSKAVSDRLRGKRVVHKGYGIHVTKATVFGLGANQVLLRLDFTGDARGHLYLLGKPEINTMTQTVYLSGLRYDLKTAHLLQAGAPEWLYHAPLREMLTPEIMLGVRPTIDQLQHLLQTGLNRMLTPTVSMQGTVTAMQGIAVFAERDALQIRVLSEGTLTVTVDSKP